MTPEQLFLDFHYPALKELTLQFLTLTSTLFTFSVIFAEKLVYSDSKTRGGYLSLYSAWCCFIGAIILAGISLVMLVIAADWAHNGVLHYEDIFFGVTGDFYEYASRVFYIVGSAGAFFIAGLILLGISAFYNLFSRRQDGVLLSG